MNSANAVKTRIWTARISMLLLRYLQLSSRFGWSLANLVALLRIDQPLRRTSLSTQPRASVVVSCSPCCRRPESFTTAPTASRVIE